MYDQLKTTSVKFNNQLCICKTIRINNKSYIASVQYGDKLIIFPDTMVKLGCDKEVAEDTILGAVGWNHVKLLTVEVINNVVVTRYGTILVFDTVNTDELFTYSPQQHIDPITYASNLRSYGVI